MKILHIILIIVLIILITPLILPMIFGITIFDFFEKAADDANCCCKVGQPQHYMTTYSKSCPPGYKGSHGPCTSKSCS